MSTTGKPRASKAFTLIEIMLVVIILGIILAIAAPSFSRGYARIQLNETADDILMVSRWAQAMAIGQERIYALNLAHDHRSYNLMRFKNDVKTDDQDVFEPVKGTLGRMHKIPDPVGLVTDSDQIEFYPDGTIDQAKIELSLEDKKIELSTVEVRGMMTKVNNE